MIMSKHGFRRISVLLIFIWAGMLLGISFLEAPLKFHAPHVTLAIGVGIGRLVFGLLNKIEIVLSVCLIFIGFYIRPSRSLLYLLGFVIIVLLIQTFWLLPALDARALIIMAGNIPSERSPHLFYVGGEIIKLVLLITLGLKLFSESIKIAVEGKQ